MKENEKTISVNTRIIVFHGFIRFNNEYYQSVKYAGNGIFYPVISTCGLIDKNSPLRSNFKHTENNDIDIVNFEVTEGSEIAMVVYNNEIN